MSDLRMELIQGQLNDIEENVRSIKATWGNTIMTIDNIKSSLQADRQKAIDEAYQRGLNDAWECARKISLMSQDEIEKVFPGAAKYNRYNLGYSGVEAIEKLKAYEEQKDEIKVGDEVEVLNSGNKYLIAWFAGTSLCGFAHDGVTCRLQPSDVRKTGRHFDIQKILEEMKE